MITTARRLELLRRLAAELESREPTPERDELLRETRDRIAGVSGAVHESGAWRVRRLDAVMDRPARPTITFHR